MQTASLREVFAQTEADLASERSAREAAASELQVCILAA